MGAEGKCFFSVVMLVYDKRSCIGSDASNKISIRNIEDSENSLQFKEIYAN